MTWRPTPLESPDRDGYLSAFEIGEILGMRIHHRTTQICMLLLALNLWVFQDLPGHDFVNFDDTQYITENRHVRSGLTWRGVVWAFSTGHVGNWHPLTWLSHMLDCQGFGMNPGWHHLHNLFLHSANTLLLFLLLKILTGAWWRSALVAALFAVHPLHVESVAWVSERKDVLSTFFMLLSTGCYAAYARKPTTGGYILSLLFFALGLMSKPMLVTLPFLFLLLDYWPLGRFRNGPPPEKEEEQISRSPFSRLILEKIPFFLLAAASSAVTFVVQKKGGLVLGSHIFPEHLRLANALVSYVRYIGKMLWPEHLAVYYVHPATVPLWETTVAGALLLCLSLLVLWGARRQPYLPVGWLWYVGALVPVIGLVHVGGQAMADRYTYVPSVGLFILTAWGLHDLARGERVRRVFVGVLAVSVILASTFCARVQAGHWKNSITLWRHTLEVRQGNFVAHNMLGGALAQQGRFEEACKHFEEALAIRPGYEKAHYYMGLTLMGQEKYEEAREHLSRALEGNFDFPEVIYDLLGVTLLRQGRWEAASEYFRTALRLNPFHAPALFNLGTVLEQQGQISEAVSLYSRGLETEPQNAIAHFRIGRILYTRGETDKALSHYSEALRANPDLAEAYYNMGVVLEAEGKFGQAMGHFTSALRIRPDYVQARNNLGALLARQGRYREAVGHFRAALRTQPDFEPARVNLEQCLRLLEKP